MVQLRILNTVIFIFNLDARLMSAALIMHIQSTYFSKEKVFLNFKKENFNRFLVCMTAYILNTHSIKI